MIEDFVLFKICPLELISRDTLYLCSIAPFPCLILVAYSLLGHVLVISGLLTTFQKQMCRRQQMCNELSGAVPYQQQDPRGPHEAGTTSILSCTPSVVQGWGARTGGSDPRECEPQLLLRVCTPQPPSLAKCHQTLKYFYFILQFYLLGKT